MNALLSPIHLGSMQATVRFQIKERAETLKDGDVILSNHPQAGGNF